WLEPSRSARLLPMPANAKKIVPSSPDIAARVDAIEWTQATADLDAQGCAILKGLLSPEECRAITALYPDDKNFRSRIVMGRHGNCLHQDIYGEHVFPIQVAILLSDPGKDFTGGEFVLTEQRPRMQSRAEVVALRQGDAVAFAVHHRPVQGTRGFYRVNLRHGVSQIHSGHRHTVGVIFHDAK